MADTTDTSIALLPLARQAQVTVNTAGGTTSLAVQANGSLVGTEAALDFVDASGIAFGVTDDSANGRVKITPVTTAAGDVSGPLTALVVGAKKVLASMLGSGAATSGQVAAADGSGGSSYVSAAGDVSGAITALAVGAKKVLATMLGSGAAASGTVATADGAGGVAYLAIPTELDYVEFTAPVTITATTEAGATSIVAASAHTFDGTTAYMIEFFAPGATSPGAGNGCHYCLYDGASSIGFLGDDFTATVKPIVLKRRLTPSSASHTYSIRAWKDAGTSPIVSAGAGGAGNDMPGWIRITEAKT